MATKRYLFLLDEGCDEPQRYGPFASEKTRERRLRRWRRTGYTRAFCVNIKNGTPTMYWADPENDDDYDY